MLRLAVAGLLACMALAGCNGASQEHGGPAADGLQLRGVVVDAAIRPVADAVVTLAPGGAEQVTGADGAFAFAGLAPGAVAVTVRRDGYLDTTLTATVAEGAPALTIRLEAAPDASPYASAYVFEGFIDCGTGHFAACGAPFAAQTILCGNGGPCTENVTDGRFITFYTLDALPAHVQSEAVWEATQAFGDSLVMIHFASTPEEKAAFGGRQLNETVGPNPLLGAVNGTLAAKGGLGLNSSLAIGVYGGKYCGVPGVCHENIGLVVQQRFRIVTHAFYHYVPPEGWRFSTDGTVPPP